MSEQKNKVPKPFKKLNTLRVRLTVFLFLILAAACFLTVGSYYLLFVLLENTRFSDSVALNPIISGIFLVAVCAVIALLLFAWLSKYYLRPIKQLTYATKEVRRGNFKIRVGTKGQPKNELSALMDSFNKMIEELDSIELFRNDFINSFSHEFKTPIVSIRGFARELRLGDLSPEQSEEYIRIIEEESNRLAALSAHVLELSRLEHQQILTNQTEFDLDEQIRQCILLLEPEWSEKDITIEPTLVDLKFYSNEELLAHVWQNLLANAVKFTPRGGRIEVEMQVSERKVRVLIRDNGMGMDEETQKHIFEKFYQGDRSRTDRGYGIGLSIAHRAVSLCKGSIEVTSTLGLGSTFTVTLPRE